MPQPIRFPDKTLKLPIQCLGSVDYYALMAAYGTVIIDDTALFDKRFKLAHRVTIVDTQGVLQITIPTAKVHRAGERLRWTDIPLSTHGHWWDVHRETIASAYGRTPYYEFYADRLLPFFSQSTPDDFGSVADYDREVNKVVCRTLGLENHICYSSELSGSDALVADLDMTGANYCRLGEMVTHLPYYQVRSAKLGFIPSLSILDLLCNLGPTSPLLLYAMTAPTC